MKKFKVGLTAAGFCVVLGLVIYGCQKNAAVTLVTAQSVAAVSNNSVLQYHKQSQRTGLYVDSAFTKTAAAAIHVDPNFSATVTGNVYTQPLFIDGQGSRDLVIVATEQNHVTALDGATGSIVWDKTLGTPVPLSQLPCGNIDPLGISGTPVIDWPSQTIFVDAMTTTDGGATAKHLVYGLSLVDGSTVTGWPVDVAATATFGSQTFTSKVQNQRGALLILNNTLYVPYGGHYGDCGAYHGWVVGFPLNNPSAVIAWATGASEGGIWAPGGLASDGTSIFGVTGNTGGATTWSQGEAFIRLPPNLNFSGKAQDYYAPLNWASLDASDSDLGGSGPTLFSAPGATPSSLAMALGKDGNAYLIGQSSMGGIANPLAILKAATGPIRSSAAAYTAPSGTYVAYNAGSPSTATGCPTGQSGDLMALKISQASPPVLSVAWCAAQNGRGAPIVTSVDGSTQFIVWSVGAEGDNLLHGFDGETGQVVFAGGGTAGQMTTVPHFNTITEAKGRIFVPANNKIYAFTLK